MIEVVDLVWKGLRHYNPALARAANDRIEVVDLVWKGLRHLTQFYGDEAEYAIEVVDLVWKGLRLGNVGLPRALEERN